MVSSQVSLDSPVSWKQQSFGSKRRMQIAGRPVNADGQGPDGCLALFLHQRALQNSEAPLSHAKRDESPPFPSEMQIFPSTEKQTKGAGGFCEADSSAFLWASFCSILPGREGKDEGVDEDIWGVSTLQRCHLLFGVQSKGVPVEGQPRR